VIADTGQVSSITSTAIRLLIWHLVKQHAADHHVARWPNPRERPRQVLRDRIGDELDPWRFAVASAMVRSKPGSVATAARSTNAATRRQLCPREHDRGDAATVRLGQAL
jgi:hypothetical protein